MIIDSIKIERMFRAKKLKGGYYLGYCPGHNDKRPSFIFRLFDRGGMWAECLKGCAETHIRESILVNFPSLKIFTNKGAKK